MWRQCRQGSWYSLDLMKCSTRSFRLPTVHRSEGRIMPLSFSSFSSKSLFSFLSMKREFLFLYLASLIFTLSDAVRRVKPFRAYQTKQTNSWTGNKKNGSTLCNSTVLKRQTESSCHTWMFLQQYLTGVRIKPMASLSSPLLTKKNFHPFLIRKERCVS